MDLSTKINIVVTRLNQLTKLTKALEKVNITNKRIIEKFEQMDGSSRKLAENLSEANKSADKGKISSNYGNTIVRNPKSGKILKNH